MFFNVLFSLVLLSSVTCLPHVVELDSEERQLYRAAYDDSYDDDDDVDVSVGVLTPKDSMWLMKAKLKELKEFTRALCANLLSTKLKIKQLVSKHKLHKHDKKPAYSHQSYQQHPTYEPQQYGHEGHYNY